MSDNKGFFQRGKDFFKGLIHGEDNSAKAADTLEAPAAFLNRKSTTMGQRLYIYLKHTKPTTLEAHKTYVFFQPPHGGSKPEQIPMFLILSMLLPIVNSREVDKTCGCAVLATQSLMEYLLTSTYWDDVNASYYTRLSWVLLSLNGAIEELILLIKKECGANSSCVGFDKPLQSLPPIAANPAETVANAAEEMCSRFTSVTQLLMWLCVSHAATTSKRGHLNVQRFLLEGIRRSKKYPNRGVGEGIETVSGQKHYHLLTHVICLHSRRPHNDKWERAFINCLSQLVNSISFAEARGIKVFIHTVLQREEDTERLYGIPKDKLVTELNKFVHVFFSYRMSAAKEANIAECNLQLEKWWPTVQKNPPIGSLLALLYAKYPQTQRNWATPVGLLIASEMLGYAGDDKLASEYLAVAIHNFIFVEVDAESDLSNTLKQLIVSQSLESEYKANKFVRLLKMPPVIEVIQGNAYALSFINYHLPAVLAKVGVTRGGFLLIGSEILMNTLSPDTYPRIVEIEAPRATDSWAFLEIIATSTWSDKIRFPFVVPSDSKLQIPNSLADKVNFMKFSFADDRFPFITMHNGDFMLSAASWAWLNALSKMTPLAARLLCKYVTDLNELSTQAVSESNLHNVFKFSLLLDSLLCHGTRSMPSDHVKVPTTTFTDLSKMLYHLMDSLESNADFPACQLLSDEKKIRALYPFHCEVRSVEEEIHQTARKLGEGGLPEFIFKSTPKQVEEYFTKCAEKGAGVSEKGKKALDHLRASHAQAIEMISSMREGINESFQILSWLTKVRKDLYKIKAEEWDSNIVFPEISQQMQEGEAAMKALKADESVQNTMRTKAVLETLERALFKGVAVNAKPGINILLLDPIRKDAPYSALFHGFFMQFAVHIDSIGEALTAALTTLEEYIADPFRPDDKEKYLYVTKVDVTAEMALLRTWRRSIHEDASLEVVQNTLEAIQVREIMGTAHKLLIAEGLPKQDYGPLWTAKEVQSVLGGVNAETLRIWRAVIGMQSIVKAVVEVMEVVNLNQYIGANVPEKEIKATCIPMLSNHIGSILTRMRGLGSDASYDVLVAFNHYVGFVSALILSAANNTFTLAGRLQFLEEFQVDHNATKDEATKMLNENLGEVVRIVEVQGSTTETGRIKMELSRVQKDLNACIAVCICSKKSVTSKESSAFQSQNLSVRLLTTNNNAGGRITVSQSDDELVAFEERVVMLENEEKANTFSEAWRLATDLLELLAHAEWLGLRKESLQLHHDQRRSIAALPDPSIDNAGSFYIYSVPVNSISQTERTIQGALIKQLDAFIGEQRAIRDRNQWALAFPRRIANDAIDAKERGLPLSQNLQGEMAFVLLALEVVPTDNSAKLGIDINNAMDNLSKAKSLGRRRVDILWYSSTNADEDNTATSETFQPVYFGEAMRFAMERHSWNPLPFDLLWCTPRTSVHDIERFLKTVTCLRCRKFTVIGTEALPMDASHHLLKGIARMVEQDAALNLLILTGSDEVTFGQLRLELLGSNVLNKAKDEAQFVPPQLPRHRAGGKEGPYCTFITGDYQSGKSHLARKQSGIVAFPHTGDALDLSMTIAFFKKAAQEKAPPKAVWIDINSYMISPTPKDPHKLQTLNYILWMLINHRLVIDEATGSTVLIPKDTHLYIEVPKSMMFCSSVPASMKSDSTMSISACAHLGNFVETSSTLRDFDISDKHAKVAAGLSLLVSQDARMVCRLGQNWDWGHVSQFGVGGANVSERDNRVREVLTQCFECNLLPKATLVTSGTTARDIVIANNGRFASLLQLLYSRFHPLLSAFGAGDWIVNYMIGFLKAMKKIVEQTVARWSEDCIITHTNLVRQPIFLPTADSFITYPQSMNQDDQDLLKLCKGSFDGRESMVKELKAESDAQVKRAKVAQLQGKGDEKTIMAANSLSYLDSNDVDLSYVLTGVGNMPDMKDLQQAFDAVGFVTVDDILIRALHCVERQQSRVSLIIEGGTGVGKSFLLSMMFRIQIQYVVRRAITLVRDFLWCEFVEFERKKDQNALHQRMVVFGLDPKQEFPKLSWFTHTEKGEQLIANMYGPDVLKKIAPVFEDDADPAPFFQRFDKLISELLNYPVLATDALPDCMKHQDSTGKVKQRTFDDSVFKYFESLLSSHVEYEYKIVAHPDTKREDIIRLLEKPTALSKALRKSTDPRVNQLVIPVFIDENNTLIETAGLVKTIMCDRRNPMQESSLEVDDELGVWFVGAINKKSEHYRTQDLHPSLKPSVSRFEGISSSSQQHSYIEQTLRRCAEFLSERRFQSLKEQLVNIMLKIHQKSEELSKRSTGTGASFTHLVSQREFHKVDAIIRTVYKLLDDKVKKDGEKIGDKDILLVCSCLTAVYYVYVARIRGAAERTDMKNFMERLCRDGDIRDVYFPDEANSIVDAARKRMLAEVVTKEAFKLGSGIALTDTLKENIFLTLLACTSLDKNKLCLAIIGDSGMGKTLSSRIVERSLKGKNSDADFCTRLPQTRFFYIQGATTTTSEQVSRVCERAQKDQERDKNGKSIVSFDEASLPKSERLVHKSLHEPVDRKIISIIVLSNKPFDDEANQNRFLVVWNESLFQEEVQELTAGCLEYDTFSRDKDDLACIYRPVVTALTQSYFDLRTKGQQQIAGQRNTAAALQMRDYVYLLKYLAESSDGKNGQIFTPIDLQKAIEINYGTSAKETLQEVLTLFFSNMKQSHAHIDQSNWASPVPPKPRLIEAILQESYSRYKSDHRLRLRPRFKILIDPTETYCVANAAMSTIRNVVEEHNPGQRVIHITVSELEGDRKRSFEAKTLSKLRIAMERGDHVVIRNPERLLSYLFDVLNLNYTSFVNDKGEKIERAIVALGAETDLFDIHPLFLITFVFSATTIERLEGTNVPFLSRCEKYLLRIDYNEAVCKYISEFAQEWTGKHNIHMLHPQLTVASAIASTATPGSSTDYELDPEHVFRANCQLLSLISPQVFLRLYPKLARGPEYAKVYLDQHHFSFDELINSASAGTCTMACTTDTLALKRLTEESDHSNRSNKHRTIIDVESSPSFEDLATKLNNLNKARNSDCIILVISSQRTRNADFMWALCNAINELAGGTKPDERSRHPFVIISGAPCNVTAVFTTYWRYIFLDSCSSTKITRKLLQSYITKVISKEFEEELDGNNASAASIMSASQTDEEVDDEEVDDTVVQEILRYFVATHQAVSYSHYSESGSPYDELSACAEIPPIKEALLRSLADGLLPSSVSKLVHKCVKESTDQALKQPFMAILHQESKAAFLEGSRPLLRLIAGSALIDRANRVLYTGAKKSNENSLLASCIQAHRTYCASELPLEEGKPKIYITNHPESGAHRHPLSSWIVPVIWHRVSSFNPASTQEKGQQCRLDEVILELSTAIPPEFNLQALPQNEKDKILLDVMQQCGFLPPTTRKLKYSEKSAPGREVNGYEKAVLMAVAGYRVASGTRKKPEEVSFIRDLLLAASTAVGSECGWLRQDLMTSVFLGFLQSSGIRVAGKESQVNIAKNIANSIRTSYTSSVDGAYVGLSYLFSFLFRTQSPVAKDTNALGDKGTLAIVAMLTDLDRTLLSGSLKPEERKKLVENAPAADSISLEYLDKYARHCGMLSPSVSSLTWYLAGLLDRPKELSKKNSSLEDSIKPALADLEYWVRNGSIVGAGNNPLQLRPFFWPIFFALIDIVFESAAPLSNKSSKDKALANTVEACSALTSSLLPLDYNPTLKSVLVPQASPAGAQDETSTFLKKYLLHAFTNRIKVVLSATCNSLGESMRKLNQQCELNPAALVRVALEVATCSLIATEINQQAACMEIERLTVAPKRPFFFNAPASGKQNDPFAMYLLLAYYERAKTIDGAKELLKTGAAAPNKIELFKDWSSKDQAANRNAIQFCVPASVREAEQFAEVKMIIAEGGSVAAFHPRVVLHALREEVYLSQLMNPDAANAKRQAYTAACQEISGRLHPLSKKVAEFLLRPVADTSAIMYANLGTPASGLIEGLTEATRSNYVVPALVTYIMIEVATRLRKEDEHPTNFWEMLMITPTFFKGQSTFGDLFGSKILIHGFDCGAKFDETTGEKQQRCNSIPDNIGLYSLFALLYGGILAYFLLNPDKKSIQDSVDYFITSTLLNDIAGQKANVAKPLQPIHAAAFTCQQHLGFLEAKGYNAQTILLHLMSTFNASIQSPPPVKCLNFADAEKYHSIFATMVPKQSDIRNEAHSINRNLAEGEWERQVLSLFKTLPGLDAPDVPSNVSESEEPSVTKDLLDEYAHALEVAQIAPKIARLYTALNEVSSKLSSEKDKDPNAITVKRIKQVAGQTAPAIAAGIEAFNKLLTINGGQLAVECRDQLVPALSDDTSVFEYVSKDPLLLPGSDSKELDGYLVHAIEAIRKQIPSIEALEERTKINADVKKVIDNAFLAQSASLWSMYNASSSSSDGMRDAAYKILSKFCEDKWARTQDVRSLEVAIQNFFVLPAMQIQIERGAIFAHFNFPRPAAADTKGLKHLEAEVRSLLLTIAEQRDTVKWPFDRDELSEDDLVTKLKETILSDPSLCFAFLTTAKMFLLEDTSANGKTNRSRESIVDIPDWPAEIRTILARIIPEVRSSASFGARNAVLTRAHLPGILSDLLVIEDHYLEAATQEIGRTAFLHPLPSDAADAFKSVLTDKKSVFGKRKVADRIDLVEQFSDVIAQACSAKKPADHVSLIFEEYGEPELTSLIPDMGQHPITLRCAAGLLATIYRVKAEVYQPEHERKTHSRKYQWDIPEHLRINEDIRSELSNSDGGDSRLDTLTSNFEDILNHDEHTIVFNTEVAQSAPEVSYFRSPNDLDDDMPDYTDINNEDCIHPNAEQEDFEHFEDGQEGPPQYLWESAHAEGIANVVENCFTSGRPGIVRSSATNTTVQVYQFINNPTLYIDTILEPGATRPSPPAAKHTSIVSLVPSHQVSGKFSVGTVVTTPSDKVAQVPTGYVAFEEGGRVLPNVAGYKGIPVIYSSPSSSAHTFVFRITGTDKDAKFPVCSDLSIGAATVIVESKKKGTTYVPCTNESPIAPETVVTANGKVIFNEAPCSNPFIAIKSQHGKANFELLKPTDLISGTSVTAESVATISSNHKPNKKPFVQGTASLAAALITRRAVATAVGNAMYIFRANVIDLCSGTVNMASLSSPKPTLSGTDLLAELVRTKALDADVDASTCTISNAVSCQVISVHDSISFEDRICIHLKDARAKETTVDIVLNNGGQDGQHSGTFLLDARLSQVFAVMNPGNGVWWEGIKISDSVFENLRIGQLCSAKGTWMSPTISAFLQGNNEEVEDSEAEDFFPDDNDNHEEEEAEDFFATEEEEKEEVEELKLPQEAAAVLHIDPCDYVSPSSTENSPHLQLKGYPNALPSSLRLTFTSSEQPSCPVRIHSPDSDEPFEFQLSDPVSDESIINLLCIARSMPRLLIVPAILEADTPAQGVITVVRKVATPLDDATHGSPQIDIYMSPAIQFDVTLFEHFQIYGGQTDKDSFAEPSAAEALSASALNLQVAFFSPANDKTDREATTARKLLASAEQHSETFTTSRDEDSEKNSKQFLQIALSSIAATNHGLTLLGQAAPLVHCYPIGANVYKEDESDEPNNY